MSWWICCFISCILVGAAVAVLVKKSLGKYRFIGVELLAMLCAYVIYIPVFFSLYDFLTATLAGCINLFHVMSLEANFLDYYDIIVENTGNVVFSRMYCVLFAFVHMALPAISALTAFTLFAQWLSKMRMGIIKNRKNSLYVFSEINYDSQVLAGNIRQIDAKGEIVFLDKQNIENSADLKKKLNCRIFPEDIADFSVYAKNRRVYLYCISENQDANLNKYLDIMEKLTDKSEKEQENIHIYVSCNDSSAEILIDSAAKGLINVSLINEERTAVYNLLEKYPLVNYEKNKLISVLVCGFSPMAQEMIRAVAWCGQLYGYELKISVAVKDAEEKKNEFEGRYPGLFYGEHNISFYEMKNLADLKRLVKTSLADVNYIVSADINDSVSLENAVTLRCEYYKNDPNYENCPPVFVHVEDNEKARAVSIMRTAEAVESRRVSYNLIPFGVADEIYNFENLTESRIENLAKNIHLAYEEIFTQGKADVVKAMREFNAFEVNKNASIANAVHIRYKLLMLGLDYSCDESGEDADFDSLLNDEAIDGLVRAEHDRWMAFLESEGWESATYENTVVYQNSHISRGRHKCTMLKLHPYITDYDSLAQLSEKLGLPDATIYDIGLIKKIPEILSDKWGVTGKKYRIVRRR